MSSFSCVMSPGQRMARPGPGNRWRPTKISGRPSSRPSTLTSSLNNSRKGSTSFMFMRAGRPPTLWCDLMVTEGPPVKETLSITGIECALREKFRRAATIGCNLLRLGLEHVDEQFADDLALRFRVADAIELAEKLSARIHMHQRDVVV